MCKKQQEPKPWLFSPKTNLGGFNLNQVLMSKLNQVIHLELITESGMNPSNLQMWIRTKMKYK